MQWYFTEISICIFLMTSNVDSFSCAYLPSFHMFSLVKYLFTSFALFFFCVVLVCVFSDNGVLTILHVIWIHIFYQSYDLHIFSSYQRLVFPFS